MPPTLFTPAVQPHTYYRGVEEEIIFVTLTSTGKCYHKLATVLSLGVGLRCAALAYYSGSLMSPFASTDPTTVCSML